MAAETASTSKTVRVASVIIALGIRAARAKWPT